MIRVLIPFQAEFRKYEAQLEALYREKQSMICDSNSFEFIRDNTLFYMFLNDDKLIGAIYYFVDDGKLFLNGFSFRKCFKENLDCLLLSMTWFKSNVYAEAQNRASALCLLRCGFKRVKGKLFCKFKDEK